LSELECAIHCLSLTLELYRYSVLPRIFAASLMHGVFKVPELLELIFRLLPEPVAPSDVLNCALVCNDWAAIGLRLLWRCPYRAIPWMTSNELVTALSRILKPNQGVRLRCVRVGHSASYRCAFIRTCLPLHWNALQDTHHTLIH
jgi:hypothetical protein